MARVYAIDVYAVEEVYLVGNVVKTKTVREFDSEKEAKNLLEYTQELKPKSRFYVRHYKDNLIID